MILWNTAALPQALLPGLSALAPAYQFALSPAGGIPLRVRQADGSPLLVTLENGAASIVYDKKIHFFRAFSLLLQAVQAGETALSLCETPQFDSNGAMFDVSQSNAVLTVGTVEDILRRMAMMGLNVLMMYCEDSFDVKEEPYFGYMRARYTEKELRACDDYANQFGIEMIPCIQTLAHLIDALKWPAFDAIKEDPDTLLVGSDETYRFLEHLLRAATQPFRSRRIHIGMDEALKLGRGTYLTQHGLVPSEQIMKEHLARVVEITRKLGLQPMMWSDMFFSAYGDGNYYDPNLEIPSEAAALVPADTALVGWDYYHTDETAYEDFIRKHRTFGKPIFAGGIWTWMSFGANWGMTFASTHPALTACKKNGVREVFATIWGDNGAECNVYASLLGLSLFAEHGYARDFDQEKFESRFAFCCGANYEDFYALRLLDEVPGCKEQNLEQVNASKYLLWQDLLTGLFDANCAGLPLNQHYAKLAETFRQASGRNGAYGEMFTFYYHLSHTLARKAEMGLRITAAYRAKDRETLAKLAEIELPDLQARVEALRTCHKENWFRMNKAIGWDVFDLRYGALLIRIRSAMEEISDYLAGKLPRLEELEEPRRSFNGKDGLVPFANRYARIVSASRIAAGI